MSLQAFKGDLELMTRNVVNMVIKQQRAKGVALTFDRKSLMGYIESSMPQKDHYVFDFPVVDYAGGLGPFFSKLPGELRDDIISDLLASGNPLFMGVSRAMNMEGMALIYKKGVFRVKFGCDVRKGGHNFSNCPRPTQDILAKIQNLHLKISSRDYLTLREIQEYLDDFHYLDAFRHSPLPRGICNIDIVSADKCVAGRRVSRSMMMPLRGFKNFDMVVLGVDVDKTFCPDFPDSAWKPFAEQHASTRDNLIKRTRDWLSPRLGEGVLRTDKDGFRLTFHPRKPREEKATGGV